MGLSKLHFSKNTVLHSMTYLQKVFTNRLPHIINKHLFSIHITSIKLERKMSGCCPENSWGKLNNPDYKAKGIVEKINETNIDVYRVGKSEKCIIWNYDVFGFDGGRTRQMADFVAEHGYMVIIPDYYRGQICDVTKENLDTIVTFLKRESKWEGKLNEDWEKSICPYATKHGAKSFGTIGFCWGSYPVVRLSADPRIKAGVSMHPSHPKVCEQLQEDEKEILKEIKCPQFFLPADGDSPTTKFGGIGKEVLGDALEIVEFPEMQHGWSIRGDLGEQKVVTRCQKGLQFDSCILQKVFVNISRNDSSSKIRPRMMLGRSFAK